MAEPGWTLCRACLAKVNHRMPGCKQCLVDLCSTVYLLWQKRKDRKKMGKNIQVLVCTLAATYAFNEKQLLCEAGHCSLQRDNATSLLDLLLQLLGSVLPEVFLDLLRGPFHELLRLLQSKAGGVAHHLEHRDLLVRRERIEHDGELGLLLRSLRRRSSTTGRGHHHRRSRRGARVNAEGL